MTKDIDIFRRYALKELVEQKLKRVVHNAATTNGKGNLYYQVITEVEESLIRLALDEVGQTQTKAAKILGINRNTLRKKIKDFDL